MKAFNYLKDKVRFFIAFVRRNAIANISIHLFSLFIYSIDNHYGLTILCVKDANDNEGALLHLSYQEGFGFSYDVLFMRLWRHCV
jgi:hypothetical protein